MDDDGPHRPRIQVLPLALIAGVMLLGFTSLILNVMFRIISLSGA